MIPSAWRRRAACSLVSLLRRPYSCYEAPTTSSIIAEWQQFRAGYLARFKPTWPVDVDLRKIYPPTIMGQAD